MDPFQPGRFTSRLIGITLLSLLLVPSLSAHPALADAGPELEASTEIGSSISPYRFKSTRVQMVDEQVRLKQEMIVNESNTLSQISVQADFHMRNTSGKAESMQAVFPLTDLRCSVVVGPAMGGGIRELEVDETSFALSVDGQTPSSGSLTTTTLIPLEQVDYFGKLSRSLAPEALTESRVSPNEAESIVQDANGNEFYPCKTQWKTFRVRFPPHEDVRIRVSYVMKPKLGYTLYPWDTFTYILITGRPWYGPIGQVDVSLQLPYPVTPDLWTRLPPGSKIDGDTIRWRWKNIEPSTNLRFAVLSPQGWKELQARREQVLAHPDDASGWAQLGDYYSALARPPDYPAGYYDPLGTSGYFFPQVVDWRYARLAVDAYQHAIRLQPQEDQWHTALGQLYASMSLSANNGLIRFDYPSAQRAVRELEQGISAETDAQTWLTMFKDMAGEPIPLR